MLKTPPLPPCFFVTSMLTDPGNKHIRWSSDGSIIIITDSDAFQTLELKKYLRTANFSSFVRQLSQYGFQRLKAPKSRRMKDVDLAVPGASEWHFSNDNFRRGKLDLLDGLHRRPVQKEFNEKEARRSMGDNQKRLFVDGKPVVAYPVSNFPYLPTITSTQSQALQQQRRQRQKQQKQRYLVKGPSSIDIISALHLPPLRSGPPQSPWSAPTSTSMPSPTSLNDRSAELEQENAWLRHRILMLEQMTLTGPPHSKNQQLGTPGLLAHSHSYPLTPPTFVLFPSQSLRAANPVSQEAGFTNGRA